MSKITGNYCLIDLNNKTANCDDKYNKVPANCKVVRDPIKTFYNNPKTASLNNQTLAIARDPNIDYNYFRANK